MRLALLLLLASPTFAGRIDDVAKELRKRGQPAAKRAELAAELVKLASEKPEAAAVQRLAVQTLYSIGKPVEAIAFADRLVGLDDSVDSVLLRAHVNAAAGRWAEAAADCDKALELDPDNEEAKLLGGVARKNAAPPPEPAP